MSASEMPLHAVLRIADHGFAEAGERHRLDRHAGFLADLARDRLRERLADLDHAAGQRVHAVRRRAGATHHQDLAVAYDRGADRQERALGIGSRVCHDETPCATT
jgi:hypothetical protein